MRLTLIGIPSSEPVPSHGGPALSINWTLRLNGVEIATDSTRQRWVHDPKKRQELADSRYAPPELRRLEARLREANMRATLT